MVSIQGAFSIANPKIFPTPDRTKRAVGRFNVTFIEKGY